MTSGLQRLLTSFITLGLPHNKYFNEQRNLRLLPDIGSGGQFIEISIYRDFLTYKIAFPILLITNKVVIKFYNFQSNLSGSEFEKVFQRATDCLLDGLRRQLINPYDELKLSAASHGESSILRENYNYIFARLPRSSLRGMRLLSNSIIQTVL